MANNGFIGLGIMGRPMATNLLNAGCSVMVNDADEAIMEDLASLGAGAGLYRVDYEQRRLVYLNSPEACAPRRSYPDFEPPSGVEWFFEIQTELVSHRPPDGFPDKLRCMAMTELPYTVFLFG